MAVFNSQSSTKAAPQESNTTEGSDRILRALAVFYDPAIDGLTGLSV